MDRSKQMESIQEGLKEFKKNEKEFNSAKETAKLLVSKHPELQKDQETNRDFTLLLIQAIGKLGKEKVTAMVDGYLSQEKPKTKLSALVEGTAKSAKNPDVLFLMIYAQIERANLAHRVYVLSRSSIREDITFPKDEPDEDGNMPTHRTMSVTLWDADLKKIISMFLVDDQVDTHSALEVDHSYMMQMGNYNKEKDRWFASKDPSITKLDGFQLDEMELARYLLNNYKNLQPPYDEAVEYSKSHPGTRYVCYASYVKMPTYIQVLPGGNSEAVSMPYSSLTSRLGENGNMVVMGAIQKSKPREGQPATTDYVLFPELIIPDEGEDQEGSNDNSKKEDTGKSDNDDLANILG